MQKFSRSAAAALLLMTVPASASYFELSANGAYNKYTNGKTLGELNTETTQRMGAGIAYNFFGNVLIDFKYTQSKKTDRYTQFSQADSDIYRIRRVTEYSNFGTNLVLEFAPRKSQFRPYISGGVGYMIRKDNTSGTVQNSLVNNGEQPLNFRPVDPTKSISADAGIGFKLYIIERIAFEGAFNVLATDLDKPEIFLHYSGSGGLRFVF